MSKQNEEKKKINFSAQVCETAPNLKTRYLPTQMTKKICKKFATFGGKKN